jgi:hypothetical protein
MISTEGYISFFVTIVWFLLEALVHYNIGKTGSGWIRKFPDREEFVLIITSIAICSFLSTTTTNLISGVLNVSVQWMSNHSLSLSLSLSLSSGTKTFVSYRRDPKRLTRRKQSRGYTYTHVYTLLK